MPSCTVPSCKNTGRTRPIDGRQILFHNLPKDSDVARTWLVNAGVPECEHDRLLNHRVSLRICSEHFSPEAYRATPDSCTGRTRRRLQEGATPTPTVFDGLEVERRHLDWLEVERASDSGVPALEVRIIVLFSD